MLAQEGDRWTVTVTARFRDYPPEHLRGFCEFARNLHAPDIYEVVCNAEPIGEPSSARFPASIRLRYEKLKRFTEAICFSVTPFVASTQFTGKACP
jgi:hypothetical protein